MESRGRCMLPFFGDDSTTNYSMDRFLYSSEEKESYNTVFSSGDNYSSNGRLRHGLGRGEYFSPSEMKMIKTRWNFRMESRGRGMVEDSEPDIYSLDDCCRPGLGRDAHVSPAESKILKKRDIFSLLSGFPEEEIDHFVALYINRHYRNSSEKIKNEHLEMVFKLGQCVCCYRPSLFVCSTCKAWYCSKFCLCFDSEVHRKTCTPKSIVGFNQDDGTFNIVDNEQFSNTEETVEQQAINESRSHDDNGNGSNRRGGEAPRRNQRNNNYNNQEGSDRTGDNPSSSVKLNRKKKKKCRNEPFEAKVETSIKGNIQDGNHKPSHKSSTTTHKESLHGYRGIDSSPQPPIPYDQFTEVTVTVLSKEKYGFWAFRNSVFDEQAEIVKELTNLSKTVSPLCVKLKPGFKVCAPFDGNWYRAEVKHINGDKVRIFFIDFGNEDSVDRKDILPLPRKLVSKPVLAHQYFLANSSDNPMIAENIALKLKPIRMVGDAWLAHVEGVKYELQTEVIGQAI